MRNLQGRKRVARRGYRSAKPGTIVSETSQLLCKVMIGSPKKVYVRDAAIDLDVFQDDIRDFIRDLVPVAA